MSYFCLGHQKSQIEIKAMKLTVFKISNRNCLNKINVYGTCSQRDPRGLKLRRERFGDSETLENSNNSIYWANLFNRHRTENLYALCTHYTHNPKGECSEKKMTQEKVDHWQSKAYHMTKEKANDKDKEGLFS